MPISLTIKTFKYQYAHIAIQTVKKQLPTVYHQSICLKLLIVER